MFERLIRPVAVAAALTCLALPAAHAQKSRADCDRDYKPTVGQSGKDVIWVPTPDGLITRMFQMAKLTPQDTVVDLGAGDGKIALAAGRLGATAVGIEYNPDMARLAQCYVAADKLEGKVRIIQGDIFKEDFSKASVVTMYLLPELNLCTRHRLLAMRPGTRVVTHAFSMGDWQADESAEVDARHAYLWIVPAVVEGTWTLREQGGTDELTLNLSQAFQKVSGDVVVGGRKQPLVGATLRGDELRFAFNDAKGTTRNMTAKVNGAQMTASVRGGASFAGTAASAPKAGAWAARSSGCERFYGG